MDYSPALIKLKKGCFIARKNWGKGTFIYLVEGSYIKRSILRNEAATADDYYLKMMKLRGIPTHISINSHIDMHTSDDSIIVGWVASQADTLANNWYVLYEPEETNTTLDNFTGICDPA